VERIPNRGALVRGLTPLEVKRSTRFVKSGSDGVRIIPFPVGHTISKAGALQRRHTVAVAAGDC